MKYVQKSEISTLKYVYSATLAYRQDDYVRLSDFFATMGTNDERLVVELLYIFYLLKGPYKIEDTLTYSRNAQNTSSVPFLIASLSIVENNKSPIIMNKMPIKNSFNKRSR